jgi:outer membrane protein assembly factor BamB
VKSLTAARMTIVAWLLATIVPLHGQWPQFRGPNGDGTAGAAKLPLTWSEEQSVRWKTPIHGRAWSSPVVQDNQVWVTTATEDGRDYSAVALDLETGKVLHDLKIFHVDNPEEAHPFNSYASPTPVIEKGRLYVSYGRHGTAAIDTTTGKTVWQRQDIRCNHFRGAGSSPILFRNLLILHFDGIDVQFVVALDKETGKTVWRTPRSIDFQDLGPDGKPIGDGDFRKAYATPHMITVSGQPLLISLAGKAMYAYDPMTGKERWHVVERKNHSASTRPVFGHGLIFYPTGWDGTQLFAVRPDGSGDVTATHVVWRFARSVPVKPSVLLVDDLVYMISDSGIASAVDAKSGTLVWQSRVGGSFSASPLSASGRIYLFDEDGKTTVIEAGRTFKVLAENFLDNGFMASPAVAGDALIVRTTLDVYRIEAPAPHPIPGETDAGGAGPRAREELQPWSERTRR